LGWLGSLRRSVGDLDGATALLEESLARCREVGNTGGIAHALLHLGGVASARQQYERAQALIEQSLALYRDLGYSADEAYALSDLASLAAAQGDFARARVLCDDSVARFRQLGDARGLLVALSVLGRAAALRGDDEGAIAAYAECLSLDHAVWRADLVLCLEGLAQAVARQAAQHRSEGQLKHAAHLFGAAAALRRTSGDAASRGGSLALVPASRDEYAQQVAATRAALGEEAFAAAWAAGTTTTPEMVRAWFPREA
jgi:tetratricopeptide (TPR) repeat protein